MVRVGVIGGGTAGTEAAHEAALTGADVTVIEPSDSHGPPWAYWPDLIRPDPEAGTTKCQWNPSVPPPERTILATALRADPRRVTTDGGARIEFDSVILCTGSAFSPPAFQGSRKSGVYVLDTPWNYASLAGRCASSDSVVVGGEGYRGLVVAARLSSQGRAVRLLASRWRDGPPSSCMLGVIRRAASEGGVILSEGSLARALGQERVEAVIAEGELLKCDTLAYVPERVPKVIPTGAQLGPAGGILVDGFLRTSAEGVLAAGGCAELECRPGVSVPLDGDAGMSGRIAGSNSVGRNIPARGAQIIRVVAFGLRFTSAWFGSTASTHTWTRLDSVNHSWSDRSACTIAFERSTGRVIGIQLVEPAAEGAVLPVMTAGPSLRSLAYGVLGSTDISLLADTARQALRVCPKY